MKSAPKWGYLAGLVVLAIVYVQAGNALVYVALQHLPDFSHPSPDVKLLATEAKLLDKVVRPAFFPDHKINRSSIGPSPVKGRTTQTADTKPDLGSISGNVYTNEFFGITYTFPQGWVVDKAALEQQTTNEEKFHASQPQTDRSTLHGNYTLLMVSKIPEEIIHCKDCVSIRVHNPNIILSVGIAPASDELQTASDIQNKIKQMFDGKGLRFVNGPTPCSFNGQTFSRIDTTTGVVYQGDALTIRNHYQIEFRLFADTPEQLEDLYRTLNTVQLKP